MYLSRSNLTRNKPHPQPPNQPSAEPKTTLPRPTAFLAQTINQSIHPSPPLFRAAVKKQQATQERKDKNQARADELAKDRQDRADAKVAALAQAAIDRKEKQEGIAERIEVGRSLPPPSPGLFCLALCRYNMCPRKPVQFVWLQSALVRRACLW